MEIKSSEKEKICSCCEGRIAAAARVCPYCASGQEILAAEEGQSEHSFFHSPSSSEGFSDSLAGLYSPPYGKKAKIMGSEATESSFRHPLDSSLSEISQAPFTPSVDPSFTSPYKKAKVPSPSSEDILAKVSPEQVEEKSSSQLSFFPVILLLAGGQALLVAFMLLFFARGGVLCLEWKANQWPFYLLASGILLFLGRRQLKKIKE